MRELGGKQAVDPTAMQEVLARGMSPRQATLDRAYQYYRGTQHEGKIYGWTGGRRQTTIERAAERAGGNRVFPGQYVEGGKPPPYDERYPSVRSRLCYRIVRRFTTLMFSKLRKPSLLVEGDEDTQEYMVSLLKAAHYWDVWAEARNMGGGTGTAVVTFGFENGKLVVESHDARWCHPEFKNRRTKELKSLDIRLMYTVSIRDTETGLTKTHYFWFRRVIDEQQDITYKPALITEDPKPIAWEVDSVVTHGFGEVPGVWVHNVKEDGVDGSPDLSEASFDTIDQMDQITSENTQGVKRNVDPTLVIVSAKEAKDVAKGSNNAIQPGPGGLATYLTMPPGAVEAGNRHWEFLRNKILEDESCVLDLTDLVNATATEVHKRYEAMEARVGELQEQYAENGVIPLTQKIVRAIRKVDGRAATDAETGKPYVERIHVPPSVVTDSVTGKKTLKRLKLGTDEGELMSLQYAPLSSPTLDDVNKAATAVTALRQAEVADKTTLVRFVAKYLGEENPQTILDRLAKEGEEKKKAEQELMQQQQQQVPDKPTDEGSDNKDLADSTEETDTDEPEGEVAEIIASAKQEGDKVVLSMQDFVRLTMLVPGTK